MANASSKNNNNIMEDSFFVSTPSSISPCLSMDNLSDDPHSIPIDSVATKLDHQLISANMMGNWTAPTAPSHNDGGSHSKDTLSSSPHVDEIFSNGTTTTEPKNPSSSSVRIPPCDDELEVLSMERLQQEHDDDSFRLLHYFSDLKFDSSSPPPHALPTLSRGGKEDLVTSSSTTATSSVQTTPAVPTVLDVPMDPNIIFAGRNQVLSAVPVVPSTAQSVPDLSMDPDTIFVEKHLESVPSKSEEVFQGVKQKKEPLPPLKNQFGNTNNHGYIDGDDDHEDLSLEDLIQIGKASAAIMGVGGSAVDDGDHNHDTDGGEISLIAGLKRGGIRGSLPPIHLHYGNNASGSDAGNNDVLMNTMEDMLTRNHNTTTVSTSTMDTSGRGGSFHEQSCLPPIQIMNDFSDHEKFIGHSNPSPPTTNNSDMLAMNRTMYPVEPPPPPQPQTIITDLQKNFVRGLSNDALLPKLKTLQSHNKNPQRHRRSSASSIIKMTKDTVETENYLDKNQNALKTVRRRSSCGSIVDRNNTNSTNNHHKHDINPKQIIERFKQSMTKSLETQKALQLWDKATELSASYSQTMVNTARTRQQLQEGVILAEWDGCPLVSGVENNGDNRGANSSKQIQTLNSESDHKRATLGSSSHQKRTTLGSSSHKRRPRRTSKSATSTKSTLARKTPGRRMSSPASITLLSINVETNSKPL